MWSLLRCTSNDLFDDLHGNICNLKITWSQSVIQIASYSCEWKQGRWLTRFSIPRGLTRYSTNFPHSLKSHMHFGVIARLYLCEYGYFFDDGKLYSSNLDHLQLSKNFLNMSFSDFFIVVNIFAKPIWSFKWCEITFRQISDKHLSTSIPDLIHHQRFSEFLFLHCSSNMCVNNFSRILENLQVILKNDSDFVFTLCTKLLTISYLSFFS